MRSAHVTSKYGFCLLVSKCGKESGIGLEKSRHHNRGQIQHSVCCEVSERDEGDIL